MEVQHRARSCSFGPSLPPMTFAPWACMPFCSAILLCCYCTVLFPSPYFSILHHGGAAGCFVLALPFYDFQGSSTTSSTASSSHYSLASSLQVQVAGETCPLLPSLRHHSSNGSPLNHINHTYSQPVGDRSCHTPALLAPCRAVAMTPHTAHGDDSAGRVGSFHFRQSPTPQVIPTLARRAR